MPRLGELLVSTGTLTAEQIDQAVRAQVVWGGRLGTNLVELGHIDLDKLAATLGRQHRLPAALGRHFERADPEVQRRLPVELAERYSCVPLLFAGTARTQLIVAAIDPIDTRGLAMIAMALGSEPDNIIQAIAGELRIRYHLERVFKIQRHSRFLRARGATIPPFPTFEIDMTFEDSQVDVPALERPITIPPELVEDDLEIATEVPAEADDDDFADVRSELRARLEKRATSAPPTAEDEEEMRALEAIFDDPSVPELVIEDDSSGRERRRYVRTIDAPPAIDSERSLGRIAIKRVPLAAAVDETPAGQTLGEATRAIRRSTDRDRVAVLVSETLFRFMLSCDASLMLVVRGAAAISWKGFARSGAALAEIAVPLDQTGLLPRVIERCQTMRLPASELGPIDQLLLVSLGAQTGDLVVVPVSIGGQVMCVIAMATQHDASVATAESIAAAAGAAFARLMRNASR